MIFWKEQLDAKTTFAKEIDRGRSYVELNSLGTMGLLNAVHMNCHNFKVCDEEVAIRRIKGKSYSFITDILEININNNIMYAVLDKQTDYLEFYYANFSLFIVSTDNYTAIDNGTSLGYQLPPYTSIESTGDYFNYMVQVKKLDVPYEFFVILHDLHDKMKTLW